MIAGWLLSLLLSWSLAEGYYVPQQVYFQPSNGQGVLTGGEPQTYSYRPYTPMIATYYPQTYMDQGGSSPTQVVYRLPNSQGYVIPLGVKALYSFPWYMENFVQRIQSHYSVYNSPNQLTLNRPLPANTEEQSSPTAESANDEPQTTTTQEAPEETPEPTTEAEVETTQAPQADEASSETNDVNTPSADEGYRYDVPQGRRLYYAPRH